jgi:transposase
VDYAGLGARVYISGQQHSTGKLTKRGRKELRTALIQVAHHAGSAHEHWQERIGELTERMSYQQAVVAVARSLLVVIWHVLTKREADRFADPQKVARRFLAHVYDFGDAQYVLETFLKK